VAKVVLNDQVPMNIVELTEAEYHLAPSCFEQGQLIILKDFKIKADIDFLSAITLPPELQQGHVKFVLTHPAHAEFDGIRAANWAIFKDKVFDTAPSEFSRFYDEVFRVNDQLHSIASVLFPRYRFHKKRVTWKFERIDGQNLHIDNIQGCEHQAQLRVFVNLANSKRHWSIAEHISVYANRNFEAAKLADVACDPLKFNHRLSSFSFGNSIQDVPDARHSVELDPGEVWILNSAVTAHQVRFGRLLALNCLEFPYEDYEKPELALPSLIKEVVRQRGMPATVAQEG
jgi:hypothetical protein